MSTPFARSSAHDSPLTGSSAKGSLVFLIGTLALLMTLAFSSGCEQREKVLDIETPDGEIEVHRVEEPDTELEFDNDPLDS